MTVIRLEKLNLGPEQGLAFWLGFAHLEFGLFGEYFFMSRFFALTVN